VIYGDGSQSRDFTFVSNNVEANLLACTADGIAGEVFNIACGVKYTLLELVAEINKVLGKAVQPVFDHDRSGDVKHSLAGISRAEQHLGYHVKVDFSEGITKAVQHFTT
jgi:UDP-glucose 4-epimerase